MKKNRITSALLALALISAAAPLQAAQEEQKTNIEKAKQLAKKQVSESIDRLKRCIKGNCSRMEALKVARDVTVAVIALYIGGRTVAKGAQMVTEQTPPSLRPAVTTAMMPLRTAAGVAQLPGAMILETLGHLNKPVRGQTYQNILGTKVKVTRVSTLQSGQVVITYTNQQTHEPGSVPLRDWVVKGFVRISK